MGLNRRDLERMDKGPVGEKIIKEVTLEEVSKIIDIGDEFAPTGRCSG